MFLVDTNVLVYASDDRSPFHEPCRRALARWKRDEAAWFLTWGVVYEFLRVVTHPGVLVRPQPASTAWEIVEGLLASPGLTMLTETPRHPTVTSEVLRDVPRVSGNFVHDAHIAILMREHGVRRIYTRDAAFRRFAFLEVVDPVAEAAGSVHERPARYRAPPKRRARR